MPRPAAALARPGAGLEHTTIDMQLQRGSVQAGGRRPLHFAARALGDDSVSMIRTLLEAGADPMSRDLTGIRRTSWRACATAPRLRLRNSFEPPW